MSFFNSDIPIFQRKASAFAIQDLPGLWRVHWQIKNFTLISTFYTRHDQACILWSFVSFAIFATAQFMSLSWTVQAVLASLLTVLGVGGMAGLTWQLTQVDRLSGVLHTWMMLMLFGIVVTDLGIFLHWGQLLLYVCPLWLGLSAIGYLATGIGLRSRIFILFGAVHLLAIWLLPYLAGWQPLSTGLVIGLSVLLMAELQWDANQICEHHTAFSPVAADRPQQTEALEGLQIGLGVAR